MMCKKDSFNPNIINPIIFIKKEKKTNLLKHKISEE